MADKTIKYAGLKLKLEGAAEFVANMKSVSRETTISYEKLKQFRYMQSSSGGALQSYAAAQEQLTNILKSQTRAVSTLSMEMQKYRGAGDDKAADKLSVLLEKQRTAVERTKKQLRSAVIDVEKLKNTLYQTGEGFENMGRKWEESGMRLVKAGAVLTYSATRPLLGVYRQSTQAAMELESQMANVRKVTDLNERGIKDLTNSFRQMSKEIPVTTGELAEIAESGGRLFKTTDELKEFTRVMADLRRTTNIVGEENVDSFIQFGKIAGVSAKEYKRLGSAVVELGNNFATNEHDIMLMTSRIASAGTAARLTAPQMLGIGTAMAQMGVRADRGGTSFSKMIMNITKEVTTGGKHVADFAKVAGMSADEFVNAWQTRPMDAMQAFFDGLGKMHEQGQNIIPVLSDLDIKEVRLADTVRLLAIGHNTLRDAVGKSNKAWEEGVALQREAAIRYSTTESQIQIQKNRLQDVAVTIGRELLPFTVELTKAGADLAESFMKLSPSTRDLIIKLAGVVAVLGPAVTTVGAFKNVFGGLMVNIGKGLKNVAMKSQILPTATKAVTDLAGAENLAAEGAGAMDAATGAAAAGMLGPMGIVAAVMAAIGALGVLYHELTAKSPEVENVIENNDKLIRSFDEVNAAMDSKTSGASIMADRLLELSKVVNPTNEQISLMKVYVARLNEEVPGLSLAFNDTTNSINMTEKQLKSFIGNMGNVAKQKAIVEKLGEACRAVADIDMKVAQKKADIDTMNAAYERLSNALKGTNIDAEGYIRNHGKLFSANANLAKDKAKEAEAAFQEFDRIAQDAINTSGRWFDSYASKKTYAEYLLKERIDGFQKEGERLTGAARSQEEASAKVLQSMQQNAENTAAATKNANDQTVGSYKEAAEGISEANEDIQNDAAARNEALSELAKNFEETLSATTNRMGTWADGAVKQNEMTLADLQKNLDEAAAQYQSWHDNMMSLHERLPQQVMDKLYELGPAYSGMISQMANMTDEELQPTLQSMLGYFHTAIQSSIDELGYLPEAQYNDYIKMLNQLGEMGVTIPDEYYRVADEAAKRYKEGIGGIPSSAEERLSDANAVVERKRQETEEKTAYMANKVRQLFDTEYENASDTVSGLAGEGAKKLKTASDTAVSKAKDMNTGVTREIDKMKVKGTQLFTEMPGSFGRAMTSQSTAVTQGANVLAVNAREGLKSQNGAIFANGQYTARGAINGIYSMRGQAYDAGASIARSVNRGYRQTLDIHSPSRVMKEGGKQAVQGVILGIKQNMHKAYEAMQGVSNAMMDGLDLTGISDKGPVFLPNNLDGAYNAPSLTNSTNNTATNVSNIYLQYFGKSESEREQFERLWGFINERVKREESGFAGSYA